MGVIKNLDESVRRDFAERITAGMRLALERAEQLDDLCIDETLLGNYVSVQTEKGPMVGQLLANTVMDAGAQRIVASGLVYLPSSGSIVQAPLTSIRVALEPEIEWMHETTGMFHLVRSVERNILDETRLRQKGDLVDSLLSEARGMGLQVEEVGGFYKVEGGDRRAVYLSRNTARIDLAGFCIDHPLVSPVDVETAKERKLGRVRGQALGIPQGELATLWRACLEEL